MLVDISRAAKQFESDEGETRDTKFAKFLIREKVKLVSFKLKKKHLEKIRSNYFFVHRAWQLFRVRLSLAKSNSNWLKITFGYAFLRY